MVKSVINKSIKVILSLGLIFPLFASAQALVEFHIAPGTGEGPWNKFNDPVRVTVGQTLRIINDDSVDHTLHTNGSPCPHGSLMSPGGYWDCQIFSPHSAGEEDLYDHEFGPDAQMYIEAN